MWAVRAILVALVVVCVVAFAYFNVGSDQIVSVNLIYAKFVDVPLITVVFWSFVGGVFVSLIVFVSVYIRMSVDLRSTRRKVRSLESEVTVLRNRPIEESAEFIAGQGGEDTDSKAI